MVKHIVMWTVKATDGFSKEENCFRIKEKLMALPAIIDEIKEYEVGVNSVESAAAFDVVLISGFESWDDLDVYRTHPDHVQAAQFVGQVVVDRAVVDYEI